MHMANASKNRLVDIMPDWTASTDRGCATGHLKSRKSGLVCGIRDMRDFAKAPLGKLRHGAFERRRRHCHDKAFVALVLSGGYEEAGAEACLAETFIERPRPCLDWPDLSSDV